MGVAIFAAVAIALVGVAPDRAYAACKNADARAKTVKPGAAERAVKCLVNNKRSARGLKKVKGNRALGKAARRHSRFEDRTNCISHQCPGEPNVVKRVQRAGYPGCSCRWNIGEVIGWRRNANSTPRAMVDAWMASAAHRAHLLDRRFRHIGAGVAWGSPRKADGDRTVAGIYTAVLGYAKR